MWQDNYSNLSFYSLEIAKKAKHIILRTILANESDFMQVYNSSVRLKSLVTTVDIHFIVGYRNMHSLADKIFKITQELLFANTINVNVDVSWKNGYSDINCKLVFIHC